MSELKKPINQWEREQFIVVNDVNDDSKELTADEFKGLVDKNGFVGINLTDRVKFLEDNGYEVTRANLVDPSLSAKKN